MENEEKEIDWRVLIQGLIYSPTVLDAFLVFAILVYRRPDGTLFFCTVSAAAVLLSSSVETEGSPLAADADTEAG